jgi:hypothetical protein
MIKNKGKEIIGWVYPDPVCVKFANISRRKFPNSTEKNEQIFHHHFQNFARKIDRNQKKI